MYSSIFTINCTHLHVNLHCLNSFVLNVGPKGTKCEGWNTLISLEEVALRVGIEQVPHKGGRDHAFGPTSRARGGKQVVGTRKFDEVLHFLVTSFC